jgi:hypothetical protein
MKEIAVTFTKEEADYLEFYLRWSSKRLFGNYDHDAEYRRLGRSIVKKTRTALAEVATKEKAEVDLLEKMLGPDVKPE